jgi:hypothetical protein
MMSFRVDRAERGDNDSTGELTKRHGTFIREEAREKAVKRGAKEVNKQHG